MRRNDDPSIVPWVLEGMAKALLLGLGRGQEAVGLRAGRGPAPHSPRSSKSLARRFQAAQRGAPVPLKPRAASRERRSTRCGQATRRPQFDAARAIPGDPRAARAALAASRYRFPAGQRPALRGPGGGDGPGCGAVAGRGDRLRRRAGDLRRHEDVRGRPVPGSFAAASAGPLDHGPAEALGARTAWALGGAPGPAQAAQAPQPGAAGDADPVVFPGQRVAKLSDYVQAS